MKTRMALLATIVVLFSINLAHGDTDVTSFKLHMDNGLKDIADGDLFWAKKEFEYIIRQPNWNPADRSLAHLNLGYINIVEGDLDQATKNLQIAIQLNPSNAEAYFNLGGVFYKEKLLKKAEEAFLKAIEIQPDFGRAHYALGFVYLDQKKYDLAKQQSEKAADYGVPYKTLRERLEKVAR